MSLYKLIPQKTFGGLFLPYAKNYINNKYISLPLNDYMEKQYNDKVDFENYVIFLKIETRKCFIKQYQVNKINVYTHIIDTINKKDTIKEIIKSTDNQYIGINCNYLIKYNKNNLLEVDVDELNIDNNEDNYLYNFDFLNNKEHIIKDKKKKSKLKYVYENIYLKLLNKL
jgi:hypothetical protein